MSPFQLKRESKTVRLAKKLQDEADKEWEKEVSKRKEQELNDQAIAMALQAQLEEEHNSTNSTLNQSSAYSNSTPPPIPTKPAAYNFANTNNVGNNNQAGMSLQPQLPPRNTISNNNNKVNQATLNTHQPAKVYQPGLQFNLSSPGPSYSSVFNEATPKIVPNKMPLNNNGATTPKPINVSYSSTFNETTPKVAPLNNNHVATSKPIEAQQSQSFSNNSNINSTPFITSQMSMPEPIDTMSANISKQPPNYVTPLSNVTAPPATINSSINPPFNPPAPINPPLSQTYSLVPPTTTNINRPFNPPFPPIISPPICPITTHAQKYTPNLPPPSQTPSFLTPQQYHNFIPPQPSNSGSYPYNNSSQQQTNLSNSEPSNYYQQNNMSLNNTKEKQESFVTGGGHQSTYVPAFIQHDKHHSSQQTLLNTNSMSSLKVEESIAEPVKVVNHSAIDDDSDDEWDIIKTSKQSSKPNTHEHKEQDKVREEKAEEEKESDDWVDTAIDPFNHQYNVQVPKSSTATAATLIDEIDTILDETETKKKPNMLTTLQPTIEVLDPTVITATQELDINKKEEKIEQEIPANLIHQYEEKESNEVEVRPTYVGSNSYPSYQGSSFYNYPQSQPLEQEPNKVYPTNVLKAGDPIKMSATNPYKNKVNTSNSLKPVPATDYGYFKDSGQLENQSLPELPPTTSDQDRHITVASISPGQNVWICIHPSDTGKLLAERIGVVASYNTKRVVKITTKNGKVIPLDKSPVFDAWDDIINFQQGERWTVEWGPIERPYVDIITEGKEFMKQLKANFKSSS